MFCYQCQETVNGTGCTKAGVCGKKATTSDLQDLLIYTMKGIAAVSVKKGAVSLETGRILNSGLFATVTNVSFDDVRFTEMISQALAYRDKLAESVDKAGLPDCAVWTSSEADYGIKAQSIGILSIENEDIRSLKELITYGLKGIAAYGHHAEVLGFEDQSLYGFIAEALSLTVTSEDAGELTAMALKTGEAAVTVMALLDKANTETYGHPEITEVELGVRSNPGILISGHDLKDLDELLQQTEGTGVDVYTHGEMLPAQYYPAFKKYSHFAGNYGNAWWQQDKEFASFNGPVIMTTNCLTPPKDSYKDRLYTTSLVGFPGVKHIGDRANNGQKDFSAVIAQAKSCPAPTELENGTLVGGFAHNQVMLLADKVVEAVKSGAIKKFVVMAGCDGRQKSRSYFTDIAEGLPQDTVILTAGCAKYRYNKLDLGDIGGIPRVLDAGQCNDSYSLAVIALKLKEVFELEDVNDLPLDFDIAWYEQKAVTVLLALLHLGFKNVRLGPTLPAFLSPGVAKVLIETFGIQGTSTVEDDLKAIAG